MIDLANTDFSRIDEFEDVGVGEIRKKIIVESGYSGKPISRKSFSKSILKGHTNMKKQISGEEEEDGNEELSKEDFEVSSQASSDYLEESEIHNKEPSGDDSDIQSEILDDYSER